MKPQRWTSTWYWSARVQVEQQRAIDARNGECTRPTPAHACVMNITTRRRATVGVWRPSAKISPSLRASRAKILR
jgi:hypothetical protein